MSRLPIVLTPILLIVIVGALPVILLLAVVVTILLAEVFLSVHHKLRFRNGVCHDPAHAAPRAVGERFVLRHHARALVCKKMCLISLDAGHVVTPFCVGTLVAWVVAVVSASVTIEEVVKSLEDVAV